MLALLLLAVSMGIVVWAGQHGGNRSLEQLADLPKSSAEHVSTIRTRIRLAMLVAAGGVALAVIPAAAVLLADPTTAGQLRMSPDGLLTARGLCPELPPVFEVRVEAAAVSAASPLVRLELPAKLCGGPKRTALIVRRADIAALHVVD